MGWFGRCQRRPPEGQPTKGAGSSLDSYRFMAIACHARPDSCDIPSSPFRANAAGVKIALDLQGFLMERDDETIQ